MLNNFLSGPVRSVPLDSPEPGAASARGRRGGAAPAPATCAPRVKSASDGF